MLLGKVEIRLLKFVNFICKFKWLRYLFIKNFFFDDNLIRIRLSKTSSKDFNIKDECLFILSADFRKVHLKLFTEIKEIREKIVKIEKKIYLFKINKDKDRKKMIKSSFKKVEYPTINDPTLLISS